jgi:hypothetical protein
MSIPLSSLINLKFRNMFHVSHYPLKCSRANSRAIDRLKTNVLETLLTFIITANPVDIVFSLRESSKPLHSYLLPVLLLSRNVDTLHIVQNY